MTKYLILAALLAIVVASCGEDDPQLAGGMRGPLALPPPQVSTPSSNPPTGSDDEDEKDTSEHHRKHCEDGHGQDKTHSKDCQD